MRTKEQKAAYMREYYKKNKQKFNRGRRIKISIPTRKMVDVNVLLLGSFITGLLLGLWL